MRLTLPPIQGWDFPFGSATVAENRVQLNALPLTLVFDPATQTLRGVLPEELAPAAKIAGRLSQGDGTAEATRR